MKEKHGQNHELITFKMFLCIQQVTFITQARDKCQKQLQQPDNIVCNELLTDLFLEDDKKIVFVFLRMKIKVALGGVIHPISPKISYCELSHPSPIPPH